MPRLENPTRGEKLVAGIMFFHPEYGRQGGLYLPRALRCLKGRKKLSPSRSRKPLVFAIWAAMAVELCRLGSPLAAALVLVMVECYLRPGEMLGLTSDSFLAPSDHAVNSWVVWLCAHPDSALLRGMPVTPWHRYQAATAPPPSQQQHPPGNETASVRNLCLNLYLRFNIKKKLSLTLPT